MPAKFERQLGPKFDTRDFHAQVLMTGALPMTILERRSTTGSRKRRGLNGRA